MLSLEMELKSNETLAFAYGELIEYDIQKIKEKVIEGEARAEEEIEVNEDVEESDDEEAREGKHHRVWKPSRHEGYHQPNFTADASPNFNENPQNSLDSPHLRGMTTNSDLTTTSFLLPSAGFTLR
jgi:hypothetical protein